MKLLLPLCFLILFGCELNQLAPEGGEVKKADQNVDFSTAVYSTNYRGKTLYRTEMFGERECRHSFSLDRSNQNIVIGEQTIECLNEKIVRPAMTLTLRDGFITYKKKVAGDLKPNTITVNFKDGMSEKFSIKIDVNKDQSLYFKEVYERGPLGKSFETESDILKAY